MNDRKATKTRREGSGGEKRDEKQNFQFFDDSVIVTVDEAQRVCAHVTGDGNVKGGSTTKQNFQFFSTGLQFTDGVRD